MYGEMNRAILLAHHVRNIVVPQAEGSPGELGF